MPAGRDITNRAAVTSSAVVSERAGPGMVAKSAIIPNSKIIRVIAIRQTAPGADRRLAFAMPHPIATHTIEMMSVLSARSVHKNNSVSISLNHFCVINLDLRMSQVAGNDVAKYATQPKAMAAAVRHLLSRTVLTMSARIADRTCRQYHDRDG
jgi:hypothetical protein